MTETKTEADKKAKKAEKAGSKKDEKPAAKPAPKKGDKPAAKGAKAAAKKGDKPAAKGAKPAAKKSVKALTKKDAKPAAKKGLKPGVKQAKKPVKQHMTRKAKLAAKKAEKITARKAEKATKRTERLAAKEAGKPVVKKAEKKPVVKKPRVKKEGKSKTRRQPKDKIKKKEKTFRIVKHPHLVAAKHHALVKKSKHLTIMRKKKQIQRRKKAELSKIKVAASKDARKAAVKMFYDLALKIKSDKRKRERMRKHTKGMGKRLVAKKTVVTLSPKAKAYRKIKKAVLLSELARKKKLGVKAMSVFKYRKDEALSAMQEAILQEMVKAKVSTLADLEKKKARELKKNSKVKKAKAAKKAIKAKKVAAKTKDAKKAPAGPIKPPTKKAKDGKAPAKKAKAAKTPAEGKKKSRGKTRGKSALNLRKRFRKIIKNKVVAGKTSGKKITAKKLISTIRQGEKDKIAKHKKTFKPLKAKRIRSAKLRARKLAALKAKKVKKVAPAKAAARAKKAQETKAALAKALAERRQLRSVQAVTKRKTIAARKAKLEKLKKLGRAPMSVEEAVKVLKAGPKKRLANVKGVKGGEGVVARIKILRAQRTLVLKRMIGKKKPSAVQKVTRRPGWLKAIQTQKLEAWKAKKLAMVKAKEGKKAKSVTKKPVAKAKKPVPKKTTTKVKKAPKTLEKADTTVAYKPKQPGCYTIRKGKKLIIKRKPYVVKPIGGANNGECRRVLQLKRPAYYAAQHNQKRYPKRKPKRNMKPLRKSLTPGTVCILVAGIHKGKRVVFVKRLKSGLCLITGPFKVNGCPMRRVNQIYLVATSTKLKMKDISLPKRINDAYFRRIKRSRLRKPSGDMFARRGKKYVVSKKRKDDQKLIDAKVLSAIRSRPDKKMMFGYLGTKFGLRNRMYPHMLKF